MVVLATFDISLNSAPKGLRLARAQLSWNDFMAIGFSFLTREAVLAAQVALLIFPVGFPP